MMAKEVLEDNLLSFLTDDIPEVELDAETSSQKVIPASVVVNPTSNEISVHYVIQDHFRIHSSFFIKGGDSFVNFVWYRCWQR